MTHPIVSRSRAWLAVALAAASCAAPEAGPGAGMATSDDALTSEQCTYFASNSKVNICHRTGSRRKPFELVRTNLASCGGHTGHAGDYVALNDSNCDGSGCFPVGAPYDGTVECCPGLAPVNGHCADIDECLTDNGGCGANTTCTNTVGGRTCACAPGYATPAGFRDRDGRDRYDDGDDDDDRDDDGDAHDRARHQSGRCGHFHGTLRCVDVDECATNNGGCGAGSTCTNNPGAPPTCGSDLCTGVTCTASDACHVAGTCDPATGACSDPAAADGTACSDGDACTGADSCRAGACTPGPAVAIDDGDACTTDGCDPATGPAHTPVAVDDGDACTADACDPATGPAHIPIAVDDGNACTADSCDPASGPVHTAISFDDGNACTTDGCDPATGPVHVAVDADDGDPCTDDTCDPVSGAIAHLLPSVPAPTHQWTFNDGTPTDLVGTADGALLGGATIAHGSLVVDNAATAPNQGAAGQRMAAPIADGYTTKTLVSWVALDDLTQHGGSALTLESTTTNAFAQVFDAVDYAERTPGQWMNGSDNFRRSPATNGGASETSTGVVAIAIAYDSANGITLYRNGTFYGGYTASNAQAFTGGASDVLIGLRHSGCSNNCWLSGKVDEARIYDSALSACQVRQLAAVPGETVTCPAGSTLFEGACYAEGPSLGAQALGYNWWTGADASCQATFGGRLASIHGAAENAFVRSLRTGGIMIAFSDGGRTQGDYAWLDGSAIDYTNWAPGEPNNRGVVRGTTFLTEDWATMNPDGTWNDLPYTDGSGYVCKFAP